MKKLAICGINGKMGNLVSNLSAEYGFHNLFGVDKKHYNEYNFPIYENFKNISSRADVVIDFSMPEAIDDIINYCERMLVPLVIATTGQNENQLQKIQELSKIVPVFKSANMSQGIFATNCAVKCLAKYFPDYDVEIIEKHHKRKLDTPSGTALIFANTINSIKKEKLKINSNRRNGEKRGKEIGISSLRGGNLVGEHSIYFIGENDMVTVTHTAFSRQSFAEGSLVAANYILGKGVGFYNENDLYDCLE